MMTEEQKAFKRLCKHNVIGIYDHDDDEEIKIIETAFHEKANLERKLEEYALALKEKNEKLKALEIIKEFAPLIEIKIKGKEYNIHANNSRDIALYAELYISDRLIYTTMNRNKIEKLKLLKEVLS